MIRLCHPQLSNEAIEAAVDALRSGQLVQGERVTAFEKALASYLGVKHAVATSSGTAALHLAMLALGIGADDEVICPAFTFPATVNVVERCGARPVLVDISLDDYNMDMIATARALTKRTKAIMVVHAFGNPAPVEFLCEIARGWGVPIVEDAACALGASVGGKMAGTFGKLGCFSFHPRKALTTGEGGLVVSDDDSLASRLRALRDHGRSPDIHGRNVFAHAGLNYRMTEFQAALGLSQLPQLDEEIAKRRTLAAWYRAWIPPGQVTLPLEQIGRQHSYQSYHVLLPEHAERERVSAAMLAAGIETAVGAHAIGCLPYYQARYGWGRSDQPNAALAAQRGLALPIGGHVMVEDVKRISEELRRAVCTK